MLGHEAPSDPRGVGFGRNKSPGQAVVIEITVLALTVTVDERGGTERHRGVGVTNEHRSTVGISEQRYRRDGAFALRVEVANGMQEPHGGLTPVDDGDTAEGAAHVSAPLPGQAGGVHHPPAPARPLSDSPSYADGRVPCHRRPQRRNWRHRPGA